MLFWGPRTSRPGRVSAALHPDLAAPGRKVGDARGAVEHAEDDMNVGEPEGMEGGLLIWEAGEP